LSKTAVFIDRDGTINVEKEYLYKIDDWEWIPGAIEAIKSLNDLDFAVIVISNQSGVVRGLYTGEDIRKLHKFVDLELARSGARIDAFYYCPHHPEFGDRRACDCRKPAPGLILRAATDHDIDLSRSYLIGDKAIDIEAGMAAGVTPVMVATGYGKEQHKFVSENIRYYDNIQLASQEIERMKKDGITDGEK